MWLLVFHLNNLKLYSNANEYMNDARLYIL
jgi:hypothetical protein